ncbi:hypothetical protein MRB53_034874 [Persea americana]|uniref:Uncharacterized protein n=1 Tax=Persea americana TaxID=3435 RepID=A0ACC2K3A2_PERAE|nr:hypothetical protein MRB53_034874 [Persea americana]
MSSHAPLPPRYPFQNRGVWNIAFYGEKDTIKRKRKKDPKGFKVQLVATRRHLFMEGLMKCLQINEILYGIMQFIDGDGHI